MFEPELLTTFIIPRTNQAIGCHPFTLSCPCPVPVLFLVRLFCLTGLPLPGLFLGYNECFPPHSSASLGIIAMFNNLRAPHYPEHLFPERTFWAPVDGTTMMTMVHVTKNDCKDNHGFMTRPRWFSLTPQKFNNSFGECQERWNMPPQPGISIYG